MLDKTQISTLNTDHTINWQVGTHDHHHSGIWFQPQDTTGKGLNAIKLKFLKSSPKVQVFAGFCALSGVFCLTLPIPIIVNSFAGFYKNRLWRNEVIFCHHMLYFLDSDPWPKGDPQEEGATVRSKSCDQEEDGGERGGGGGREVDCLVILKPTNQ